MAIGKATNNACLYAKTSDGRTPRKPRPGWRGKVENGGGIMKYNAVKMVFEQAATTSVARL